MMARGRQAHELQDLLLGAGLVRALHVVRVGHGVDAGQVVLGGRRHHARHPELQGADVAPIGGERPDRGRREGIRARRAGDGAHGTTGATTPSLRPAAPASTSGTRRPRCRTGSRDPPAGAAVAALGQVAEERHRPQLRRCCSTVTGPWRRGSGAADSAARAPVTNGSTQPMSASVQRPPAGCPHPPRPAAVLRMPQPGPMSASNGTTTLWVTSMTESTSPPAPQYTLKSAARRTDRKEPVEVPPLAVDGHVGGGLMDRRDPGQRAGIVDVREDLGRAAVRHGQQRRAAAGVRRAVVELRIGHGLVVRRRWPVEPAGPVVLPAHRVAEVREPRTHTPAAELRRRPECGSSPDPGAGSRPSPRTAARWRGSTTSASKNAGVSSVPGQRTPRARHHRRIVSGCAEW